MVSARDATSACLVGALGAVSIFLVQPWLSRFASSAKQRRAIRLRAQQAKVFKLTNKGGMEAHILSVGAAIQRLMVPDKHGALDDVVLGFDDALPYLDGRSPYFGAIVGRCANRISRSSFTIKGTIHQVSPNNGSSSLHGGFHGFDKKLWQPAGDVISSDAGQSITLTHKSPAGDEGYPGELTVSVTYTLTHDNELTIEMVASTTETTLVNLAAHSYFNLSGHGSGPVLDHILKIYGDHYTPAKDDGIPTGEIEPVRGTPFDFISPKEIGLHIDAIPGGGYDHNFVLHGMGTVARFLVKNGMYNTSRKRPGCVWRKRGGEIREALWVLS